jgi:hypothetical protein
MPNIEEIGVIDAKNFDRRRAGKTFCGGCLVKLF